MKRLAFTLAVLGLWAGSVQFAAQTANDVHFHHVHLNVVDPEKSITFYRTIMGAVPVKFGGRTDALFTERSFILLSKVPSAASAALDTGIWHTGWGGMDGPQEFEGLTKRGVTFQTPVTPYANNHYMYPYGPDKEVFEIWTGYQNHRFGHVHLIADDPAATVRWYAETLEIGLRNPGQPVAQPSATSAGSSALRNVDNVQFIVFRKPVPNAVPPLWNSPLIDKFSSTKGHVVDHVAFSYRRIQPIYDRLVKAGAAIVEPIAERKEFGFRSFFVQGPDQVLIEIVEAAPIPDASWEVK